MTYLALHLCLCAVLAFLRLRSVPASPRLARIVLLAALAIPFLVRLAPAKPWPRAPAQIWSGVTAASPNGVVRIAAREIPAAPLLQPDLFLLLAAVVALVLLRDALALRRKLRGATVVRRVGRVRICSAEGGPWSCALGRTGWIVLDPATARDPRLRRLALLHELQHLRQRDGAWAWALAALQPFFLWSPVAQRVRAAMIEGEELACDAAVVARPAMEKRSYAAALLEVAERALPALPVRLGHSLLQRRIEMLLEPTPRRRFRDAMLLACALGAACAGARATDAAVADHRVDLPRAERAAQRASGDGFQVIANEMVLTQLNRLVGTPQGLKYVRAALARRPAQLPAIDAALAAQGVPRQLDAMPLVESGYENLDAGEHGAGLWQFIVPTASHYGLRVAAGADERMDPTLESAAAARYLADLHRQFDEWPLAIAAYTEGEKHVQAVIEKEQSRDAWELIRRGALDPYPAKVMAAALVIADPSLAGL